MSDVDIGAVVADFVSLTREAVSNAVEHAPQDALDNPRHGWIMKIERVDGLIDRIIMTPTEPAGKPAFEG